MVDCRAVTLAVVNPVTPEQTLRDSMTTTVRPCSVKSRAAVRPVIPDPITTACAVMSPRRTGRSGHSDVAIHNDGFKVSSDQSSRGVAICRHLPGGSQGETRDHMTSDRFGLARSLLIS